MHQHTNYWGWALGASASMAAYACGGTAVIDPPAGAGGASASSNATSASTAPSTGTQSTGSSAESCEDILEAYQEAFDKAQSCDLKAPSNPCTSLQSPTLICPCALFFINPQHPSFDQLEELRNAYDARDCGDNVPCPGVACSQPASGICVPSPDGGGVCQNN